MVDKSSCLAFTDSWAVANGLADGEAEEQWDPGLGEGCTDSPMGIPEKLRGA